VLNREDAVCGVRQTAGCAKFRNCATRGKSIEKRADNWYDSTCAGMLHVR
jgi:hypothetical protein